jgi:ATP-binding cassette subfamily F protein uup
MLAQRGADLTRERRGEAARKPSAERASAAPNAAARKRQMSFKDKYALETLPKTIAAFQAEAHALQAKLDDAKFFARDRAGFEKVVGALGDLHQKIATAEEQWLELELQREQLVEE